MITNIIFFTSLGILIYIYAGYPLVIKILSFFFSKKVAKQDIFPSVSLIIPAYNEENIIEEKIINCLSLNYPENKLEIIIASESNDSTNEIVIKYEDKGIILHAYEKREGKCANLYKTVPKAIGDIIIFSDANAMFEKDAILKLVRNFNDPRIGCVSGQLKYYHHNRSSIGEGEGIYWKYEMMIKRLESELFSLLGCNGSIFGIRKSLYSPIDKFRGDDFDLALRIAEKGYGVVLEPEAVSWERASQNIREELGRKVRIISWFIASSLIFFRDFTKNRKWFLLFQLISHKILRWLAPIFLIILFIANLFVTPNNIYKVTLIIQLGFYALAMVGYFCNKNSNNQTKLINIPYYFCILNYFSLLGIYKYLSNDQSPTWEKMRQ